MTFAQTFLRIYDRKIAANEICFSRSGIKKEDFIKLCMDSSYVIPKERFIVIAENMKLSDDDLRVLIETGGYGDLPVY